MITVAALWRHPIKSHGREALEAVDFTAGQTMPGDRRWAVAHDSAQPFLNAWMPCQNFSIGSKTAALMAIDAKLDDETGMVTLTHPDQPALRFDPEHDVAIFLDWVMPLMDPNRALPVDIRRVPGRGMTDTDYPSISILNTASNADLSTVMGQSLTMLRWRGNIHLDGLEPWAEADLIGKHLRIGRAEFAVREPIKRCMATTANPETGERDADTLGHLRSHTNAQDFGIYTEVVTSGRVAVGDKVEVL